jgi:ABC-type iron transport system FetAB ATPase subunit
VHGVSNGERLTCNSPHSITQESWSRSQSHVYAVFTCLQVRHGIMLVGPSGGGKTAIMQAACVLVLNAHDA